MPVPRFTPTLNPPPRGRRMRRTPRRDQNPIDPLLHRVPNQGLQANQPRNRELRMRPATSPVVPPQPLARQTKLAPPSILHQHRAPRKLTRLRARSQLQRQNRGRLPTPLSRRRLLALRADQLLLTKQPDRNRSLSLRADLLPPMRQPDRSMSRDLNPSPGPRSQRSVLSPQPSLRLKHGPTPRPILLRSMKVRRTRATISRIQARNNRPETTASFWSSPSPESPPLRALIFA